jgi:hypothetical protein
LPPAVLLEVFLFDFLTKIKTFFFSFVISSLIIKWISYPWYWKQRSIWVRSSGFDVRSKE